MSPRLVVWFGQPLDFRTIWMLMVHFFVASGLGTSRAKAALSFDSPLPIPLSLSFLHIALLLTNIHTLYAQWEVPLFYVIGPDS